MEIVCMDDPAVLSATTLCVDAVSKNTLRGNTLTLVSRSIDECGALACVTLTTTHSLALTLGSNAPCDSDLAMALDGPLTIEELVTVFDFEGDTVGRGVHAGDFVWTGAGATATGRFSGMTNVGTHRAPPFDPCQVCDEAGFMEGRFCGTVTGLPSGPCDLVGTYRLRIGKPFSFLAPSMIEGTLEGAILCACAEIGSEEIG